MLAAASVLPVRFRVIFMSKIREDLAWEHPYS